MDPSPSKPPESMAAECLACKETACFLKTVNAYRIFHCPRCGLQFCHPMPATVDLDRYYREYQNIRAESNAVRMNAAKNLGMLSKAVSLDKDAQILDFGCGANLFVKKCRDQGYGRSFGFDRYAKASDDPTVLSWDECRNRSWGLITMWGVLEHLTDPEETLRRCAAMTAPGGHLALTTVCTETSIPYQHKPPEHTLYFSKQSLAVMGNSAGWRMAACNDYIMHQKSDIYLSILLRTMPDVYKEKVTHSLEPYVEVPTNEVCVIYSLK
jgi:hypothetical protein